MAEEQHDPGASAAPDDIRADVEKAMQEVEARADDTLPASEADTEDSTREAEGAIPAEEKPAQDADGPDRQDDAPQVADGGEDKPGEAAPRQDGPDELKAPEHFSIQDKAEFSKQPREVQEWWIKKDKAFERNLGQREHATRPYRELAQQAEPYFKQLGVDPAAHMGAILQTEYVLRTGTPQQKAAKLQEIAQTYGITDGQDGHQPDPALEPVLQDLQSVKQQLQQRDLQDAQQAQQQFAKRIAEFEAATDGQGNPAFPHFQRVRDGMATLMRMNGSNGVPDRSDLEELYHQACGMNREVREELAQSQMKAAEAALLGSKQKEVDAAKKASQGISGTAKGKPAVPNKETYDSAHDAAAAAYDQLAAGDRPRI